MRVRFYFNFGTFFEGRKCQCGTHGCCDHGCPALTEHWARHSQNSQKCKAADLILEIMTLAPSTTRALQQRRNVWIDCSPTDFALFIVERNNRGIGNFVKELNAVMILDPQEKQALMMSGMPGGPDMNEIAETIHRERLKMPTNNHPEQSGLFEVIGKAFGDERGPQKWISKQVVRKKKKRPRHIFFVLKGVAYQKPEWLRARPKADGWYFCTEGEKYVCSMPFDSEKEIKYYVEGME